MTHVRRLGARPQGGSWLIDSLEESGLRGRGGAWFPTWRKWAAVAAHSRGRAVVIVNASEGEPLSAKDETLLALRPHLVLDGAMLAAETLGADDVVLYLARSSPSLQRALDQALAERRALAEAPIRVVRTSHRYIAGESSAVVSRVSGGRSKPRWSLQHVAEKGVRDLPTLVQNAETLAHVATIARFGSEWFRQVGTEATPGTALMTLSGNVRRPGVYEVDLGARLGGVLEAAGGTPEAPAGALLGGYFGTWVRAQAIAGQSLGAGLPAERGASFGCGIVAILPGDGCAIVESARIMAYLAAETAGQCGPCVNGLGALEDKMARIAASRPEPNDLAWVWRWADMVRGRGGCHHPDGAVGQMVSALTAFEEHLESHLAGLRCPGFSAFGFPRPPRPGKGWK